jgi:hypothetical protein
VLLGRLHQRSDEQKTAAVLGLPKISRYLGGPFTGGQRGQPRFRQAVPRYAPRFAVRTHQEIGFFPSDGSVDVESVGATGWSAAQIDPWPFHLTEKKILKGLQGVPLLRAQLIETQSA